MGIRNTTKMTLFFCLLFSSQVFAQNPVDDAFAYCEDNKGTYEIANETFNDGKHCVDIRCRWESVTTDDEKKIKELATQEGASGAYVGAWKRGVCKQLTDFKKEAEIAAEKRRKEKIERERRERERKKKEANVDVDVDVDVDGGVRGKGTVYLGPWKRGDVILVKGERVVVGSGRFYSLCVKKSGKLRSKCLQPNAKWVDFDIDAEIGAEIDTDIRDRGRGGGRIVIEGSSGGGNGYVIYRGKSYYCGYDVDAQRCLKDRYGVIVSSAGDIQNCPYCGTRYNVRGQGGNSWGAILGGAAELAGAVLPPVMGYLGQKAWANAYLGSNQAWAGAAATGFEQCRMMQTHYVDATYGYIAGNELPDREVLPPECNGYNLNSFAGTGGWQGNGFGGWGNPYGAAGFSSGFMGGMYGPGVGFNPYFNASAGLGNPYGGLGYGGYGYPGMGGGVGINIGLGGAGSGMGFPGGGFGYGGPQCITYPCPGGGGMYGGGYGGYPGYGGYGYPGMGGGVGVNIGLGGNGGFTGMGGFPGYNGGMYGGGGYGGPYGGYGGYGGMYGGYNGTNPYGYGGGYYGNTGGGSVNGNGYWAVQGAHMQNAQAQGAGSYYQQAALQNQMNQAGFNMSQGGYTGGGYGYGGGGYNYNAGYSPFNIGGGLTVGFGF